MKYVVQMQRGVSRWMDGDTDVMQADAWVDVAEVDVEPRTKRSTVLKKALAAANIQPNEDGSPPKLRVLDVESAEVHEPEPYQPPMEWKL